MGLLSWFYGLGMWFMAVQFNLWKSYQLLILGYQQLASVLWIVIGLIIKDIIIKSKFKKGILNDK